VLLLLLAAGLASQLARVLIQGDWVPPIVSPLWDSSALLPTNSVLGSTLHVLIGYDAQPSGMQVVFYLTTLTIIWLAAAKVKRSARVRA
jgi:high-affinity iron transporter